MREPNYEARRMEMKPCAERQMRGLRAALATRHSCPHPAQSCCLAQLSAQPAKDRCPEWGHLGPLLPPPGCAGTRGGVRKMCLKRAAGHTAPVISAHPGGSPALW